MMNKPSAMEIASAKGTEGTDLNRYEVVVAVAKGARLATQEYLATRERAERMISNHETDKPLLSLLGPEYKDQKPVRAAIDRIMRDDYHVRVLSEEELAENAAADTDTTDEANA